MKLVLKNIDFTRINSFTIFSLFFLTLSYFILKSLIGSNEFSDNLFAISCVIIFEIIFLTTVNNLNTVKINKKNDLILFFLFFFLIYFLWNNQISSKFLYLLYFIFFQILSALFFILKEYKFKQLLDIPATHIVSIFILSFLCTGLFHQIEGNNYKTINLLFVYFIFYIFFFKIIKSFNNKNFFYIDIIISTVVFSLLLKIFLLSSVKDAFHYSWYLGPAFSSKVGGNLLQDTVSQYGYFSILFIEYFSFITQLNLETAFIFLIISFFIIFYVLFFNIILKIINYPYFIITLFLCLLLFGSVGISNLSGGMFIPSSSVYRFLPSIITIFFLAKIINSNNKEFLLQSIFFHLFLLISIFWSFESLFFIAFTVMSLCFFLMLDFYTQKKLNFERNQIFSINKKNKIFFIIQLIISILLIFILFHNKDISLFYEYVLGFEGLKTLEIINSRVSIFFITFLLINFLILRMSLNQKDKKIFFFNLIWFALFISFSSYFITRSHPNNAFSLFPFFVFFTCILKVVDKNLNKFREIFLKIIITFTIISSLSSIHYDKEKFFKNLYSNNFLQTPVFKFDDYKPSERIQEVLKEKENLPVTLITGSTIHKFNNQLNSGGYGIPILPLEQFNILSPDRKKKIMEKIYKKNDSNLILCLNDCSFYTNEEERKTWESIYYPKNVKINKILEIQKDKGKEILYILKLKKMH